MLIVDERKLHSSWKKIYNHKIKKKWLYVQHYARTYART